MFNKETAYMFGKSRVFPFFVSGVRAWRQNASRRSYYRPSYHRSSWLPLSSRKYKRGSPSSGLPLAPAPIKPSKLNPLHYKSRHNIKFCILLLNSSSKGVPCLKPLRLTILTFSFTNHSCQKDDRVKHRNVLPK